MLLLLALACSSSGSDLRPESFACGKVICQADEICLHWEIPDTAPVDSNHGCVEAPAACDDVPTCACAGDVCLEDCADDGDGVSCFGDAP